MPGLVETIVSGLLQTYQAIWHRHAAEFFEQSLERRSDAARLILAHHWAGAAGCASSAERGRVAAAVGHLQQAARTAISHCAYLPAVDILQRACRLLDLAPACGGDDAAGAAGAGRDARVELLLEMAPYTLLVYGPGSREAVAAYEGLGRLAPPPGGPLDDRGVLVLAGSCANLCGKGLHQAAARLANELLARAALDRHVAAAWALLVPPLFHEGDFEGVAALAQRVRDARAREPAAGAPALINGVHLGLVAESFWPAALACRHEMARAAAAAEEVLAAAEACGHPPTLCYVIAHLCRDYLRVIGDAARCAALTARAEALAAQHSLTHCRKLLGTARRWVAVDRDLRGPAAGAAGMRRWVSSASAASTPSAPHRAPSAPSPPVVDVMLSAAQRRSLDEVLAEVLMRQGLVEHRLPP
jgi:hypothetical protein